MKVFAVFLVGAGAILMMVGAGQLWELGHLAGREDIAPAFIGAFLMAVGIAILRAA